jgi:hypothetical protein
MKKKRLVLQGIFRQRWHFILLNMSRLYSAFPLIFLCSHSHGNRVAKEVHDDHI